MPIGSMCFSGLSVTRPSIQAVWSPNIRGDVAMGGFVQGNRQDHRYARQRYGLERKIHSARILPEVRRSLPEGVSPARGAPGRPPPCRTIAPGSVARSTTVVGIAGQGPASIDDVDALSPALADRFRVVLRRVFPRQDQRRRQDRLAQARPAARARPDGRARGCRPCCASGAAAGAELRASPAARTCTRRECPAERSGTASCRGARSGRRRPGRGTRASGSACRPARGCRGCAGGRRVAHVAAERVARVGRIGDDAAVAQDLRGLPDEPRLRVLRVHGRRIAPWDG